MTIKKILVALPLLFLLPVIQTYSQNTSALLRSYPEAEGVSSEGIVSFLDSAAKSKNEFHSIMFLRHGKVIAEGWWNPYRADLKHTMYSCSKSFTATAIGFAVNEKRISVNDKIISFFPNELPDTVSPYLSELTIKNLLTMSVGQDPDPSGVVPARDSNWVKGFLSLPIVNEPGKKFLYNSLGTYMLSAIMQKVTGQRVIDYLKPRLFEPLNIDGIDWETDPKGINTGGWGLRLKTEDMAKFGQLFLQKGMWNGKQILPASWVQEASTEKIIQHPDYTQAKRDSSDWEQGYCYQMWRCRHNAFRGDGAYGQYIIVMPEQDAVIAITSETANMQDELNLVWKYLLPAIHTGKLPSNKNEDAMLKQKLASLALPQPAKSAIASTTNISGKTFKVETNQQHITSVSFELKNTVCSFKVTTDTAAYTINFGADKWVAGETTMHGPYLVQLAKANLTGLPPFKTVGEYRWKNDSTLELTLRYIESPHTERLICTFNANKVLIEIKKSFFNPALPDTVLKGEIKN